MEVPSPEGGGGGEGGGTWVNFCWVCAAGLSEPPYQIIVYSVANYRSHLSHLCIYPIFNKEHFTFHLQYKHSGTFANRKYEELSYPKIRKCATPF